MALRVLARGNAMDDMIKCSTAGIATVNECFKNFVVNFSFYFKDGFFHIPEGEDLQNVLEV